MRNIRREITQQKLRDRAFYDIRSILGNGNWAIFYFLLGGRQAGKSYSVTKFYVEQFIKTGTPFYWLRLTERQSRQLLQNNAEKLVDPDIRRKYNLDLVTNGTNVYHVTKRSEPDKNGKTKILEKKLMARVLALSTFYADKGSGYFDNEYDGWYNIACDEFQREKNEKNTFDIMYALVNQLENLVRNTKQKIRIFFLGNTLEEASDVLCGFNFIPEQFGRYHLVKNKGKLVELTKRINNGDEEAKKEFSELLKKDKNYFGKRAVIDYIEPSDAYKAMRSGSIADILMPEASTFSNKIEADNTVVYKGRLTTPSIVLKFDKTKEDWFTIWNGNVIKKYNGEKKPVIAMKPYINEVFNVQLRDQIIQQFDYRGFKYRDLITFKTFQKEIELIKPRK